MKIGSFSVSHDYMRTALRLGDTCRIQSIVWEPQVQEWRVFIEDNDLPEDHEYDGGAVLEFTHCLPL